MKNRTTVYRGLAVLFAGGLTLGSAHAWTVTTANSDQPYTVSDSDLFQSSVSSVETNSIVLYNEGTPNNIGVLTDGTTGPGNREAVVTLTSGSITYLLDTSKAPAGYDITGLESFSGWQDNGRVHQNYVISFRKVGSGTFGDAITISKTFSLKETRVIVRDINLTGVDAVTLMFPAAQQNNGVGYKEFDLFGMATTTNYTATYASGSTAFTVSSADLLQTASVVSNETFTYYTGSAYTNALIPALTDGSFGSADKATGTCAIANGTLTYTLDTLNTPAGFTVSSLDSFTGWSDNGRDAQNFWASFRKVGNTTFGDAFTVAYNGSSFLTRANITNLNLTHVEAVRFTFLAQENGGVGYKEFDVTGADPAYTEVTRRDSGSQVLASNAASDVLLTEGSGTPGNLTLGAPATVIGTLTQGATDSAATLELAGQMLTLGGLFLRPDAGGLLVTNGTLMASLPALTVCNWSANEVALQAVVTNMNSAGKLSKTGAGTLTLYGTNACPGGTDVSAGTLRLAGNATLGSGPFTLNGATLQLDGGTLYPAQSNSFKFAFANGLLNQTAGALRYDGYWQLQNMLLNLSGGTSYIGADALLGWGGTNTTATFSGSHTATWRTTRLSSGTVVLNLQSGGKLYTDRIYSSAGAAGSVFFDGGTLGVSPQNIALASGDWLGVQSGSLSLLVRNGGAIIDTGSGSATVKRPFLRDGTSTGGLTKTGGNTLTLFITNANTFCTYAGDTVIQNGTLKLWPSTSPLPFGTRLTLATSAALDLNGATQTVGEVNGDGRIYNSSLSNAVLTVGGNNTSTNFTGIIAGAVSLVKTGTGTLLLSGANTYSNATRVLGGTLQLSPLPVTIINPGFETPAFTSGERWSYTTSDGMAGGWKLSGSLGVNIGSGIARNGSPTNAPWVTTSPQGFQIGFLQGGSYLYQTVTVQRAGTYQLSFSAANRPSHSADNVFVYIDNTLVASWTNSVFASNGVFANFATNVTLTTGAHELRFVGTVATPGGDTATAFDSIRLASAGASSFGTLPDLTFLEIAPGATLDLNGTRLTLSGISGSGLITNGTALVTGTIAPGGTNAIGTLTLPTAPSLNGTLLIDVAQDGSSDLLQVNGALDLSGLTLQIQDLNQLNNTAPYVIATCTPGSLTGRFVSTNLGSRRAVSYDNVTGRVRLISTGLLISIF